MSVNSLFSSESAIWQAHKGESVWILSIGVNRRNEVSNALTTLQYCSRNSKAKRQLHRARGSTTIFPKIALVYSVPLDWKQDRGKLLIIREDKDPKVLRT
jgi:hypothetical protein